MCRFIEPSYSDVVSSEKNTVEVSISEHKKSHSYRDAVLSHTVFSIKANVYQWSDVSNRYEKQKDVELFDSNLNGTDYFNAPVFSKEWIAHSEGKADIKVEYTFGNAKKQAVAQVELELKEGIWYLGLHINESLQLEVLLGVMPVGGRRVTESRRLCTVNLDFHT
jgi:hypothetical protein